MMMNRMRRVQMVAALVGALVCAGTCALAQDQPAANADLVKAIQALQAEVTSLKTEVAAVRADQKKILGELAEIKKASKAPQRKQRKPDTTVYNVNIGDSPILGPKDAPVTIVEFADLQCPYCTREAPVLKQILKDYPNDVRLVVKHFPLSFHKQAKPAHAAVELAGKVGKFWEMHDLIVANPKKLNIADLRNHAESLGMDLNEFDAAMADPGQIDALLAADMAEAKKCKVRGTPTILINGLKLAKRKPEGYKARIDEILAKAKKGPQLIKVDKPDAQ